MDDICLEKDAAFDDGIDNEISKDCNQERRFFWNGFAVTSIRQEDFRVAHLAPSAWRWPSLQERSSGLRRVDVLAGSVWTPPPRTTVALVMSKSGDHVELLPLLRAPCDGWVCSSSGSAMDLRQVGSQRPSLYMLLLDSVSRNTFRRKLPKTYEFLTQKANHL